VQAPTQSTLWESEKLDALLGQVVTIEERSEPIDIPEQEVEIPCSSCSFSPSQPVS
jgi:hypothetical protein